MEIIRRLWWGLYPLPRAFWGFYVLGFIAVWLVIGIPAALLAGFFPAFRPPILLLGYALIWIYWAIASVGVWRSSNDDKNYIAFWRYLARFVILIYAFMFVRNLALTFAVH